MRGGPLLRAYYDLDTPVTLARLAAGKHVEYLPAADLGGFDLVLSYTGGAALQAMRQRLGARRVVPLYGHVDPEVHRPVPVEERFRADLSYLGTYAADRQQKVHDLFIEPARRRPALRFVLGGSSYPQDFPWCANIWYLRHVSPPEHAAFYSSSRLTLNVTRAEMAAMGHCPSGRLFEAAACGTPILSDDWEGLEQFFAPGHEILTARDSEEAVRALDLDAAELARIARAARGARARGTQLRSPRAAARRGARIGCAAAGAEGRGDRAMWGLIPAAGSGTRIQPLAFSKELLPVGSREDGGVERPKAVSEYLVECLMFGGATKICFVIAPGKSDILQYYGGRMGRTDIAYVVQPRAAGLCDAIFRACALIHPDESVAVGLPDTIWFPDDALRSLPEDRLSFLLFPVERPELFDAVVMEADGRIERI